MPVVSHNPFDKRGSYKVSVLSSVLHEKVAALNVLNYILSHNYDYRTIVLVIFSKASLPLTKNILRICQQSSLNMPKLLFAKKNSNYEI